MTKNKKSLADSIESETVIIEVDAAPKTLHQSIEKSRVRQKSYSLDLRIHSPASLGYLAVEGIDTAPALVKLACVKGLDVIAITDFYSGEYIDRIISAAQDTSLTVIPGVAIRCAVQGCDDVILSCLFRESYDSKAVEEFLRELGIPEEVYGDKKYIVPLPFERILQVIEKHEGVALPSRMDKTPYRVAALPILVEQYGFRAFDLAYPDSAKYFKTRWPKIKFHLFSFSNANALAQVGSRIARVKMRTPGFEGIRSMVARESGI